MVPWPQLAAREMPKRWCWFQLAIRPAENWFYYWERRSGQWGRTTFVSATESSAGSQETRDEGGTEAAEIGKKRQTAEAEALLGLWLDMGRKERGGTEGWFVLWAAGWMAVPFHEIQVWRKRRFWGSEEWWRVGHVAFEMPVALSDRDT